MVTGGGSPGGPGGDHTSLFIALALPEALRVALERARRELAQRAVDSGGLPRGLRWTSPLRYHLTLCFLGEWPRARVSSVSAVLRRVARGRQAPRALGRGWIGLPATARARVLAVRLDDPGGQLQALSTALSAGCAELGFEPSRPSLLPHVTLARMRQATDLRAVVERAAPQLPPVALARLVLCESLRGRPAPDGSRSYPVLGHALLGR